MPKGVSGADACRTTAKVRVRITAGGRVVSTRRVPLTRSCTYRSAVTFRAPRRFGRATRARIAVRFAGNRFVRPISARTTSVAIR
jgi:hypothetical protein